MSKKPTKNNAWETALTQFNTVSKVMKLSKGCQQIFKNYERIAFAWNVSLYWEITLSKQLLLS